MYTVINEYLSKVNLLANDEIYNKISMYCSGLKGVKKTTVTVNFNRYVVDIRLNKFSVDNAVKIFNLLNEGLSYPYSSMFVRFNEGSCVRYRYMTCNESKYGFYCDIVIS